MIFGRAGSFLRRVSFRIGLERLLRGPGDSFLPTVFKEITQVFVNTVGHQEGDEGCRSHHGE